MVLKQRIDYGFNGYQAPPVPRGPRSVRRRGLPKKPFGDSKICAFELLAAVAGKLLQEGESSASSNAEGKAPCGIQSGGIKLLEHPEEGKALRSACLDQGSCVDRVFVSGHAAQKDSLNATLREFPNSVCDTVLECTSFMSGSDISKQFAHNVKSEIAENRTAVEKFHGTVEGNSPSCGQTCDGYVDNRIDKQLKAEGNGYHYANLTVANACSSKDPMEICVNTQQLINSDSSVKIPLCRDYVPNASFPRHRNNVKIGSRDDDENSVGCNRTSSWIRAVRPRRRIGHRKIRKLLTSKYWKVAPKLKDCEFPKFDGSMKHNSCTSRKAIYTSGRIQHQGPLRKRKLSDHSSTLSNDREGSSESISNSPEKSMKGDKTHSARNLHRESGSSSVLGHQASFQLRDSQVKFSIKSFKVPELYVEVPVTATVASLKRTVMEAVTAILQDGLHVGVLVQGKRVKDDNRTLLQTGISHNDNLDALGFILEPGSTIPSPPLSPKGPPTLLPCGTHQQLTRLPGSPVLGSGVLNASFDPPQTNNADNRAESNHEFVPSPTDLRTDGTAPDSRALVVIPSLNVEALAVAPVNPKSRRSEFVQRRTRRPFSVSEVEALVEAVEKLGTGRWRDVKLRAFENADHRTYVDLKDKWKTLVHTASISPGQRRGEPVPQVLLDRVLSAHAYWSQHQSKQHGKLQAEPLTISESHPGRA